MHTDCNQNPSLKHKEEGAKGTSRPNKNSSSWEDDEKYQGGYTFEALEEEFRILVAATLKLRAPNEVFDNLRERVEWWACMTKYGPAGRDE